MRDLAPSTTQCTAHTLQDGQGQEERINGHGDETAAVDSLIENPCIVTSCAELDRIVSTIAADLLHFWTTVGADPGRAWECRPDICGLAWALFG